MQRLVLTLTLCLLSMLLTAAALAGDVEDVIAAEMDSRVQEMAGNVDGYFKYKSSTYTIPPPLQVDFSPRGQRGSRPKRDLTRV